MTETPQEPAPVGPARSRFTPAERARAALGVALGVVSPEAVALDDGRVRLSSTGELLELPAMARLDTRLAAMAGREDISDQRLLVEAVAALGAEVDHSRGGSSPVDGATVALDQLLDLPDAAEDVQDEARTVLRNVLESNQLTTDDAVRRLQAERATERAPLTADAARAAGAIQREAELLGRPGTPPPPVVRRRTETGRHRRPVGARHRKAAAPRTVSTPAAAGLTATGRPESEPNLSPSEALAALRLVQPTDLPGDITTPNDVTSGDLGLVTTAEHGQQYFQVIDEQPPRGLVAHTTVRAGSLTDPHQVRIAGRVPTDQLPRVWASQIGATLREVQAGKLQAKYPRFQGRERQAAAQYDQFRLVSRTWREEQLQAAPDQAKLTQLHSELEQLAKAIERTGQPAPALPDSERALHVVPQTQAVTAPAHPNTPAHLREQVVQEMAGLEKAAQGLTSRAEFRRTTAEAAGKAATKADKDAETEERRNDSAGGVRGQKLRNTARSSRAKESRHLMIAASCDDAATKAGEASQAYGALLTKLDELEASGDKPGLEVKQLAEAATKSVSAYRRAVEATLPSQDVQHTAITSGRFPHLTKLTRELNQELIRRNSSFRYTPEVLHRRLRSATRRVLSPDGVLLTAGNDPRAATNSLIQFKVKLSPGELREVLSSPLTFDEGALAQLRQGGFSVATTTVESLGNNGGASLKTLTHLLPDHHAVKQFSQFVITPGFEYAVGQSHSVTTGAQENGVAGAVEVLNGEILRYAADAPEWRWQVREGVGEPWSQVNVVDSGDPQDATQLLMGISHTYTVAPPEDTVRRDELEFGPDVDPATDLEQVDELPELVASRVDGMDDLADKGILGLQSRIGTLDRTAHDQIRALCADDGPSALTEAARPGGFGRIIYNGGRPVAYAQLETEIDRESAELLSDSSPEHKIERIRVGFSGATGGQSFGASASGAATLGYGGDRLSDLGSGTVDLGPTLRGARNVSRGDSLNVSDVAIHPSVQRTEETLGMKLPVKMKLTFHRLDQDESFAVENEGHAIVRLPENEAADYNLPFPKAALVLDENGKAQLSADGGVLTRGCAQPGERMKLPVWLGDGDDQLRGAGPALVQKLRGADPAYKALVQHLSDEGWVPKLKNFRPVMSSLKGQDPALVASQLANLERVAQQLSRHRLETGYDQACQGGYVFALSLHHTGHPSQERSFRVAMEQNFAEEPTWLGLNRSQTATNLHIGSNTTSRSRNRSKGLPWKARLGFSDKPVEGQAGSTPGGGPSYGRSALGRFFSWVTGTTVNGVTLTESSGALADFRLRHTLTVTEMLPDGKTASIVEVEGSAKLSIDSEFCDRGEPQCVAIDGKVDPQLLQTATWQHLDGRGIEARLRAAMPAVARTDSAALHHLAAFVNVRNLNAHPEMLTTEYSTGFAVSPTPSDAAQAMAQRGLTPRRGSISLTSRIENLRYVGSGHPIIGDINLTLDSAGFTTGSSTGNTAGVDLGTGTADPAGDGSNVSFGVNRSGNISSSSNELAIRGVERLNIKDGQHYQFVGDLKLEARIKAAGLAAPQKVELDGGRVMLTLPERDALKMYGDLTMDLPLEKVADAVERMRDGNLSLDRGTATAMVRRYQLDKQGVTTGLAGTHTDEQLKALLRRTVKITKPRSQPETFEQVAADAEKVAAKRADAQLPDHYRTTMGAGLVDRDLFRDAEGNVTTLEREVQAAVAEAVPDAAGDPAVGAAIRSQLGGTRWRGHAEKIKDPTGFNLELPFGGEEPGTSAARNLRIRVRMVRTGPITIDEAPAEAAAEAAPEQTAEPGQTENALIILQGYDYTEEGRGITQSTGYGADLGVGLTDGDVGSAGLSTEAATAQSVQVVDQSTHLSRALWSKSKRAEHDFRLVVEVEETPGAGADTKGRLRQTVGRFRNDDKRPAPHKREATGRLTLLVPESDINQVPLDPPAFTDHRPVVLSPQKFLRGIQLHDRNGELPDEQETIDDPNFDDALVTRVTRELGSRRWLTRAGVQLHKAIIREELNGSARRIAFERSDGSGSPWTPGLPVPGHGSRQVRLRLRADLSGLQLVSDSSEHAQLGEAHRHQVAVNTSQESTRLLPTSQNVGMADPVTGVKFGMSFGEQAKEKISDTSGNRDETNSNESGQLVTVQLLVTFHVDARRQRTTRDHQTKVTHEATFENAATGVVTLSLFRHEFEAMQARMESGQAPLQNWNPDELAKLAKRVPVRRVSANEVVTGADGSRTVAPYRPLVEALARARSEQVEVLVTMKQQDGTKQEYRALPNGTMVGKDDNGYGAAFGALHPSLAMLAEGKVDLRALYDAKGAGERFSGTVVQALEDKGVPASALTGLDHTRSGPRNEPDRAQGAQAHAARHVEMARGKRGSGMGVQ